MSSSIPVLFFDISVLGVDISVVSIDKTGSDHNIAYSVGGLAPIVKAYPNPLVVTSTTNSGASVPNFGSIFFGHIEYSVDDFIFNIVPNDKTIDIVLWNTSVEGNAELNVTAIQTPTDTSLVLTQPKVVPYKFPFLEELTYSLVALKDGQPRIKDSLVLVYDIFPSKTFEITGLRLVVFKYSPNWSDQLEQSYKWSTDIITATDATEQRINLRKNPIMTTEYNTLTKGLESRELSNIINSWGNKPFALPLWMDCCTVKVDALSGQNILELDNTTGTDVGISTLLYAPITGEVYVISSQVLSQHPEGEKQVSVIAQEVSTTKTYEYTLSEVSIIDVSILGGVSSAHTLTVHTFEGLLLDTITNTPAGTEYNYTIIGNYVRLVFTTTASAPLESITVTIADNSETSVLTLGEDLEATLPAGTVMYPCIVSYLVNIKEYTNHTDDFNEVSVVFRSDANPLTNETTPPTQYLGYYVDTIHPNWYEGKKKNINSTMYINNYGFGALDVGVISDFVGVKLTKQETLYDKRRIKHYKQELQRRRGRLFTYWMPTYNSDIVVVVDYPPIQNFLEVENTNNTLLFDKSQDYKHIRIETSDGLLHYRNITSVSQVGNIERIFIDTPLPQSYIATDFVIISYMSFVRSESDTVTLTWEHTELANVVQEFVGVIQ